MNRYTHRECRALHAQRRHLTLDLVEATLPQVWDMLLTEARYAANAREQRKYSEMLYTPRFQRYCRYVLAQNVDARLLPPQTVTFPFLRPKVHRRPLEFGTHQNFLAFFTLEKHARRRCPAVSSDSSELIDALQILLPVIN